ncbi:glycosyltransferase family 39 protein [Micrococcus luteus]|uniref:glycosyltransferase family 39 protein n=1 Tax=Micrococcus luteus TaxID=1270 RepID=UPI003016884C
MSMETVVRARGHHTDAVIVTALIVALVVLPAIVAGTAGALWIPHNDSWAHSRIAASFAETGRVHLVGFNRASMVGMMVPLGSLASSVVGQHVFVMLCGAAMIGFSYGTARRVLPRGRSLLVAALVGVAPGFALLSTSYMTDVPMMAGIAGGLYFGARYLDGGGVLNLIGSMAFGLWATTVREQGLAAVAAVAVTAWLVRRDRRRVIFVASLVTLVAIAAFEVWRRSQPGDDPPMVDPTVGGAVRALAMGVMTLMFVCSPAVLLGATKPRSAAAWSFGTAGALTTAGLVFLLGRGALLGNYLAADGAYMAMSHGARDTVPGWLLWCAAGLAILAGTTVAALCGDVVARARRRPGRPWRPAGQPVVLLMASFLLIYLAGITVQTFSGQAMFERYLYPLIVPLSVLVLRATRTRAAQRAAAATAALIVVASTALVTLHTWSSTGVVWQAAEELVAEGLAPQDVDAGFAWVGLHSNVGVAEDPARSDVVGGWAALFSDSRQCAVVSMGDPVAATEPVRTITYTKYLFFGQDRVVIERLDPCR